MRRRGFILLLAAASAPAARAQQPERMPRIGAIFPRSAATDADITAALKEGLRQFGYIESKTIVIDWHFADGKYHGLQSVGEEMARKGVSIFVVGGTTPLIAINKVMRTRPIVFAGVSDPIGAGVALSLNRPGGNATGLATAHEAAYAGKALELLKESVPSAAQVALLYNPANPFNVNFVREIQRAANELAVRIDLVAARNDQELYPAIIAIAEARPDAMVIATDPFLVGRIKAIATLTQRHKIPAIFGFRVFPLAGGLMSYGANIPDQFRRIGWYVDKILKGEKPAELPIEQPTKFELVINLKAAKALGLTLPDAILARADEVIE